MHQSINFIFAVIHDCDTDTASFINLDKVLTMTRFRYEDGIERTEVTFSDELNIHCKETPDEILHQVRRAEIAAKTGVDPGDLATYRASRDLDAKMYEVRNAKKPTPPNAPDTNVSKA